jgi:hypothetical protein
MDRKRPALNKRPGKLPVSISASSSSAAETELRDVPALSGRAAER